MAGRISLSRLKYQVQKHANEVSYLVLSGKSMKTEQLEVEVASLLNVQLKEDNFDIPFVPFDDFERTKKMRRVFLFGPRGTGKSRTVFEIIKDELTNYDRIIFVNPRKGNSSPVYSPKEGAGKPGTSMQESSQNAEFQITDIPQLLGGIDNKDLVIWDNFPEGMTHRDYDSSFESLESISSSRAAEIYVTLKPSYLELYKDIATTIPEIQSQEIQYSPSVIKEVLKNYGKHIGLFAPLYDRYVSSYLNRISKLIWSKEPVPLSVLGFYKALASYSSDNGECYTSTERILADIINRWKPGVEYYEHQFSILSNLEERRDEVDFLYSLKLCYDIGFTRTEDTVSYLQEAIFKSHSPREPSKKLSSWVFLSGPYYSLHDAVRDAIKFPIDVKLRISGWLTKNIKDVLKYSDHHSSYLIGIFVGSNIEYVTKSIDDVLAGSAGSTPEITRYFQKGMGEGIATSFVLLDGVLQERILKTADSKADPEFAISFGENVGRIYNSLDEDIQQDILKYCKTRSYFSHGVGSGIGRIFFELDEEKRKLVLEILNKNILFSEGFGIGVGSDFSRLHEEVQKEILSIAKSDSEFARGLGDGLGNSFRFMDKKFQNELLSKWIRVDSQLARGFGIGLGRNVKNLDPSTKAHVFKMSYSDSEMARGLGFGIGYVLSYFQDDKTFSQEMFEYSKTNPAFSMGFGMGICYSLKYMGQKEEDFLFEFADKNSEFAHGLGIGLGWMSPEFCSSRVETYNRTLNEVGKKILLAHGFGIGIGYMYSRIGDKLRKDLDDVAKRNVMMTRGIGWGIGYSYLYDPSTQDYAFSRKETDVAFSHGIGSGLGYVLLHLPAEFQKRLLECYTKQDSSMAEGMGFTLGWTFEYFDEQLRNHVLRIADANPSLSKGMGEGLGYVFNYLTEDTKKESFRIAAWDANFSCGLGIGLACMFNYHKEEFNRLILVPMLKSDSFFALGFGIGIGKTVKNYGEDQVRKFFELANENYHFAYGFGLGLGFVFCFLNDDFVKNKINPELQGTDSYFVRGFGEGIGSSVLYMDDTTMQKQLDLVAKNRAFSVGMGKHFGYYLEYLPEEFFQRMKLLSSIYSDFAKGIGAGIGESMFYHQNYMGDLIPVASCDNCIFTLQRKRISDLLKEPENNDAFLKGLGIGVGKVIEYFSKSDVTSLFENISAFDASFNFGLGVGIGSNVGNLSSDTISSMSSVSMPSEFWRGYGGALGLNFEFSRWIMKRNLSDKLPLKESKKVIDHGKQNVEAGFVYIFEYEKFEKPDCLIPSADTNYEFWRGFGEGLGYHFGLYEQRFQQSLIDDMLSIDLHLKEIDTNCSAGIQREFADGFGFGLGIAFGQTKDVIQAYVLRQIADSAFIVGSFGKGTATAFLNLDATTQNRLFELAKKNDKFCKIFLDTIRSNSWDYLDGVTREKIMKMMSKENNA